MKQIQQVLLIGFVMVIYSVDMSTLHDSVYFIYFEAADICLVPINHGDVLRIAPSDSDDTEA